MKVNGSATIYHHGIDDKTMLDTWTRFNYANVWFYGGQGAGIDKGYENANDVQIRIPYGQNNDLNFGNFSIGDIVVKGTLDLNITEQADLKNYEMYNITSLKNNTFGKEPHIHIGGR